MNPLEALRRFFSENAPEVRRIVAAVSGGVDSTALLLALKEADVVGFVAVHVNHHLRGTDSDSDQSFVEELCRRFDITLDVQHVALDYNEVKRVGVEAAARAARYDALRRSAASAEAAAIATAHHRDDQAETVLMRLISGGGPLRLSGVRARTGDLVRPFLEVSRDELAAYVNAHGITPRFDAMNSDRRFTRTRIREELIPLARSINPRVDAALSETARQMNELNLELDTFTEQLTSDSVQRDNEETRFVTTPLLSNPFLFKRFLHHEIQRLDPLARDIDALDLRRIATSTQSRESVTGKLELFRDGESWTLRRTSCDEASEPFAIPITPGDRIAIPPQRSLLLLSDASTPLEPRRNATIQLFEVGEEPPYRFEVRSRRPGDRFHPLGAPAEKSLKDFLIDRKIAKDQRDKLPLLTCNDEIVWIAGVEISEKFKVRGSASLRFRVELIDDEAGRH